LLNIEQLIDLEKLVEEKISLNREINQKYGMTEIGKYTQKQRGLDILKYEKLKIALNDLIGEVNGR